MMNRKFQKGFMLLAIIAAALLAFSPAHAVDFGISGQINRAVMYVDDGSTAKWFFVDNENSSTRFRFTGSNDFENSWKVGIVWEVQMESNASNEVSMTDPDTGTVSFRDRKIEFWVGQKYGKLWVGQGDTASNSTSEVDLSGTTVAAYSSLSDVAGNFVFQDNGAGIGVTVSDTRSNFDGVSRQDRVRYDTPTFAGFYGSTSVMSESRWDAALRYSGDLGWGKLAAAGAYADYGTSTRGDATERDYILSSSASLLLPMGLNFTVSYAKRNQDNTDPWNLFGKLGYQFMEKHAASIQYGRTKHLKLKDDEADTFSLAYVFSPWKSVEFYANYTVHMLDRDVGSDPDDINVGFFGGRVKF
jgi:hypothetical protein